MLAVKKLWKMLIVCPKCAIGILIKSGVLYALIQYRGAGTGGAGGAIAPPTFVSFNLKV